MTMFILGALSGCSVHKTCNWLSNYNVKYDETLNKFRIEFHNGAALNVDSDFEMFDDFLSIHFDHDSYLLTNESKLILEENAVFLKKNECLGIEIEGHCAENERGGDLEAALALSERRAKVTFRYLIKLDGIKEKQFESIHRFGKERPLAFEHNELAWSINRRVNFVVTSICTCSHMH